MSTGFHKFATLLTCITALALPGCNGVRAPRVAHGTAPGLGEDQPLGNRGGANPNAPYMVADHGVRLVKRPTLLDVNAAAPCEAADLSLYESGARINGERRSVRLNLVNHALAPCRLSGYPAIALMRPNGSMLGSIEIEKISAVTLEAALHPGPAAAPADTALRQSPWILLPPAGEAAFEVGWSSEVGGAPCEQVGSIVIAAPGTKQSFTVHHQLRICDGRILVTALADGSQL